MTNRFLLLDRSLREGGSGGTSSRLASQASKKEKKKCAQFSEVAIDDDAFVIDVLHFFFDERLRPEQLNDDLRDVAARAVWKATEGSKAMDMVPRPTGSNPGIGWLVKEGVQIAFRTAQNKCVYEAVRVAVKAGLIRDYQLARDGVMSMSLNSDPTVAPPWTGMPPTAGVKLTASTAGIDMIAGFETYSPEPYEDAAGDCRIGYGHLVHLGPCDGSEEQQYPDGITEAKAKELLIERIRSAEDPVHDAARRGLEQHQFDALVSFVVNVGGETFQQSRIPELLLAGRTGEVSAELKLWVNAEGQPLDQLVKRREAEARLFDTGEYPGQAAIQLALSLGVDLSQIEAPYSRAAQAAPVDWCQIRHSMIRSAVEMQGAWLAAGNNLHGEGVGSVRPYLVQFWRDGVGMTQQQAEATAAISAADHRRLAFWSAAFISWCVRNAMPDPPPPHNGGFHFHMRHMAFIAQAARNRAAGDQARPFWLFDINDPDVVPEDGDILCLNRDGTNHSYQSVNQNWVLNNANAVATGVSHSDIVIGHFESGGRRWIETIGGNVDDTVGSSYYSLDAQGRLDDQVTLAGAPVARSSDVTQQVGNRRPIVFALIRLTACTGM